jgi:hypothetical protein
VHRADRETVREQDDDSADEEGQAVSDDPSDDLVEVHRYPLVAADRPSPALVEGYAMGDRR